MLARLVRRDHADQLAGAGGGEARRVADDVQAAGGVVQAEDQRSHRPRRLARPPADDRAVDRAHALHLHHPRALARPVAGLRPLGDHALGRLQPRLGLVSAGRRGDHLGRASLQAAQRLAAH